MQLYPTLAASRSLNFHDTHRIARALHAHKRHWSKSSNMFPFVQQFVADIRSGILEPHPYAFVHLLGIYKDSKRFKEGLELWQWLVEQDDSYVSQAAYGAAIELMAHGGLSSLPELEALYTQALKRFPGTFAEYHLSFDAIVPDRSQPTLITGIPTTLLQGILTARLLARDWKKAYLAFDTILRLYPTQTPSRFFELFMNQRPVTEAYTAFTMACRAGISLNPTHVTTLITELRSAMMASTSLADRTLILRAIANALYAYQEAGGQLRSLHIGLFMQNFGLLLPELPVGQDYQGHAAQLRDAIVFTAHKILSGIFQAGLAPEMHPFGALISVAGRLRAPELLTTTLQDVKIAKLDLGPIGTRNLMASAGLLQNKELIQEVWSAIVSRVETEGAQVAFEDWITFTRACRRAGLSEFFNHQLSILSHMTTPKLVQHLLRQQNTTDEIIELKEFTYMDTESFAIQMEELGQQMKNVEAVIMSGQPLDIRHSPFHMHIDPATPSLSANGHVGAIYDDYTTDPHQPPPPQNEGALKLKMSPKPMSSTGIPLDELRYQNWITILEMMNEAEKYEASFQVALSQAIARGEPFTSPQKVLFSPEEKSSFPGTKEQLRDRIKALRAPRSV